MFDLSRIFVALASLYITQSAIAVPVINVRSDRSHASSFVQIRYKDGTVHTASETASGHLLSAPLARTSISFDGFSFQGEPYCTVAHASANAYGTHFFDLYTEAELAYGGCGTVTPEADEAAEMHYVARASAQWIFNVGNENANFQTWVYNEDGADGSSVRLWDMTGGRTLALTSDGIDPWNERADIILEAGHLYKLVAIAVNADGSDEENTVSFAFDPTATVLVPEPRSTALLGIGLVILAAWRARPTLRLKQGL